jgi:hypothetical protein
VVGHARTGARGRDLKVRDGDVLDVLQDDVSARRRATASRASEASWQLELGSRKTAGFARRHAKRSRLHPGRLGEVFQQK